MPLATNSDHPNTLSLEFQSIYRATMAHSHSHDNGVSHSHDDPFNGHGHSHDILDGPGSYINREMPLIEGRDWKDRAFTIGIGGYVSQLHSVLN